MKLEKTLRRIQYAAMLTVTIMLAGCPCETCESLMCGPGTTEEMVGGERTCVVTPLSCGGGSHEQVADGQRECTPDAPDEVLQCGTGTYEQEQATGGQRECVPGVTSCAPGQIEVINPDSTTFCRSGPLSCAEGTHEQATGGQRECVLDDTGLDCGEGTQEQATGGQRECVPD